MFNKALFWIFVWFLKTFISYDVEILGALPKGIKFDFSRCLALLKNAQHFPMPEIIPSCPMHY